MSADWQNFLSGLEARGITFDQVQLASDRQKVIAAAGITDALSTAVIETEWQKHLLKAAAASAMLGGKANIGPLLGSLASPVAKSSSQSPPPLSTPQQQQQVASAVAAPPFPTTSADLLAPVETGEQLRRLPEELQDCVMAREVLAASVGFGGAFVRYTAGSGFSVADDVPQSLRSLCLTVLPVADAFVALRQVEEGEYLGRCMVVMAVGEVVSEICTSYAHQITRLQRWSEGRAMPLMAVVSEVLRVGHHLVRLRQVLPLDAILQCKLREGESMLTPLEGASAAGLSASRVLDHLFDQAARHAGSREDDDLLLLLLRRSLVPYLRMLHRWVHEGVLEDPYGEFFIAESYPTAAGAGAGARRKGNAPAGSGSSSLLSEVFASLGGNLHSGDDAASALGAGAASPAMTAEEEAAAFERRFSINKLMLPAFLEQPGKLAKMIFFAGKYCCLLRECGERLPDFSAGLIARMLTWQSVDDYCASVQETFELASAAVIQLLFSSRVDLLGHLVSLKNYFLQGRSDWLLDFMDGADELLSKPMSTVRIHTVNVKLQAAIARSCGRSDRFHDLISCGFSRVTLEEYVKCHIINRSGGVSGAGGGGAGGDATGYAMPSATTVSQASLDLVSCWDLLQLDARLSWPLTLVLDAGVMARFNGIFRLLLKVKICERRLCLLWQTNATLTAFSAAYGIRHQFVQFLRQFQFYASHFVLEPLWGRLVARIGQADSMFRVSQALHEFLDSVESGLVLSSPTRYRSLMNILALAGRLCHIGLHSSAATLPLVESALHTAEDDLLQALSDLAAPVGADYPQLVPLLTWVDFSGFYERNKIYHVQRGAAGPMGGGGGGASTRTSVAGVKRPSAI